MVNKADTNKARLKRHKRVRGKISGTASRPRLCVYRSLDNIYAQVIDDEAGVTLCSASTNEKSFKKYGGNKDAATYEISSLSESVGSEIVADMYFLLFKNCCINLLKRILIPVSSCSFTSCKTIRQTLLLFVTTLSLTSCPLNSPVKQSSRWL